MAPGAGAPALAEVQELVFAVQADLVLVSVRPSAHVTCVRFLTACTIPFKLCKPPTQSLKHGFQMFSHAFRLIFQTLLLLQRVMRALVVFQHVVLVTLHQR